MDLPELVAPYAELLGTWRGEGVGGYPTLDGDFRYGEELTLRCPGKPVIELTSRSWALDDERPLALQTGFLRPQPEGAIEAVLCLASGLVVVYLGRRVDGPQGMHVELESQAVGHTLTAHPVKQDNRMYAVRGGRLMYAMDMATPDQDLAAHLSAALERVS